MRARHSFLAAAAMTTCFAAVGCAAENGADDADPSEVGDDATSESAIVVKKCPDRVKVSVEDVSIFTYTPSSSNGVTLSAGEKRNLADAMSEARAAGSTTVDLPLGSTASGRCFYHRGDTRYTEPSITFYTKGGKNLLQIETGAYRVYATVSAYSKDGIVVRGGRAPVLYSLPTPGPYADDARTVVTIGWSTLAQ